MTARDPLFRSPLAPPYPRPHRLADPHQDFGQTYLDELLATPNNKLTWQHFKDLFGPHLPAGTYEEVVYFLPLAFEHLVAAPDDAYHFVDSLVGFVAQNTTAALHRDNLLSPTCDRINEVLHHWTSTFSARHFNEQACTAKGWSLTSFDYVYHIEAVCKCLSSLVRFERQADLAEKFVTTLATTDNPIKAAWFLELSRSQGDVPSPPETEVITTTLNNPHHLRTAADLVIHKLLPSNPNSSYWTKAFTQLGPLLN